MKELVDLLPTADAATLEFTRDFVLAMKAKRETQSAGATFGAERTKEPVCFVTGVVTPEGVKLRPLDGSPCVEVFGKMPRVEGRFWAKRTGLLDDLVDFLARFRQDE
ncbi:MAG: hypothetical protein WC985_00320 [Thermoplasmata archaeon]